MRYKTKLLLVSLALILCFGAFTGVTMALGTTATASENGSIQGGSLQVDMGWSQDLVYWFPVADSTVFQGGLWEPNYMQLRYFDIRNNGNLDLAYQLCLRSEYGFSDLAQVLDVYCAPVSSTQVIGRDLSGMVYLGTLDTLTDGVLASGTLDAGDSQRYALVIQMRKDADSRYQGMHLGNFQICLDASQTGTDG